MSNRHLIDPELLPAFDALPPVKYGVVPVSEIRAQFEVLLQAMLLQEAPVDRRSVSFDGEHNAPAVRGLLLTPAKRATSASAILHIHGGGYVVGGPEFMVRDLCRIAESVGCIILSVDYRLAPETKAPGSVEDCYAGLRWLWTNAPTLGVDRTKIAVMGESAGGGLAAALALLARDRGQFRLAYQLLDAPMIDDRTCTRPRHPVNSDFIWTFENNVFGWTCLLDTDPGAPDVSPYAAAARAEDLSGLPPTFIGCGSLDLFLDENLDYAGRLAKAGVPVELHVYPGAFHGFTSLSDAAVSKAAMLDKQAALRKVFGTTA